MGLYRYITEEETKRMKSVSDKELNELLQEALKYDDTLIVDEQLISITYSLLCIGKRQGKNNTQYTLLHESRSFDGSSYQAQHMPISGIPEITAYLMGIINGGEAMKRKLENEQRKIN